MKIEFPKDDIPPAFKKYFEGLFINVLWPKDHLGNVKNWRDVPLRRMLIDEVLTRESCMAFPVDELTNEKKEYRLLVKRRGCTLVDHKILEEAKEQHEIKESLKRKESRRKIQDSIDRQSTLDDEYLKY